MTNKIVVVISDQLRLLAIYYVLRVAPKAETVAFDIEIAQHQVQAYMLLL